MLKMRQRIQELPSFEATGIHMNNVHYGAPNEDDEDGDQQALSDEEKESAAEFTDSD